MNMNLDMRTASALAVTFALVCLVAPAAYSQSNLPGYYPIEDLGLFSSDQVEVDIDLDGAMTSIVAGATAQEDPEFADLMSNIDRIRVLSGEFESIDQGAIQAQMDMAVSQLESDGWTRTIRVTEDDEHVAIYLKQQDGLIVGLTVLVVESDEATLVNIAGTINPEMLGKALSGLGDIDLDAILGAVESEG